MKDEGEPGVVHATGNLKWSNIELKRGLTSNMDFVDWRKMVEQGQLDQARKSGSIILFDYDNAHAEVARWNFEAAWPTKHEVQSAKAGEGVCAWELLTLSVDSVRRTSPSR